VAIVHDFIKEFGGAERVLRVLADMYPEAPIYTAFRVRGSACDKEFVDRKIVESRWAWLIRRWRLYSPLRFLLPWIWESIDLSDYDLVITSCSGYIARGFRVGDKTKVVAYCHTPPRFLYGYETSIDLQKYWPVKIYAYVVNHFLRKFDFETASRVDKWVVNSRNVQNRVKKFYRKDSVIIYPPIEIDKFGEKVDVLSREDYFLIVSRLVGAKGLEEAARAASELGFELKIAGGSAGYAKVEERLKEMRVEMLGRVSDEELVSLYAKAKGFIALAKDEDFGMTVVESMVVGTPVIAFNGGGFRETVKEGVTGVLINGTDVNSIRKGMDKFNKIKWDEDKIKKWAKRFSRERFEKEFEDVIKGVFKNA